MVRTVPVAMTGKLRRASSLFARRVSKPPRWRTSPRSLGCPKATLYYYFEGKEAILAHLFGQLLAELGHAVQAAADSDGSAADRLQKVLRAHLEVIARNPDASLSLQFDLGRAAEVPR